VTGNQARLPGRVDVLVVGGGMAGMAAAMVAAEGGARTLVIEKGSRPGGSAALSVGMFWTIPDFETLRQRVPLGDPELGRAVVEEYPVAVETIRQMGVSVGDRVSGVMTVGLGHFIDVQELLDYELAVIESTGGRIACNASVRRLLADEEGAIVGATVRDSDGKRATVLADATILATGGFQGDPDLVSTYIGPNSDHMLVRSNKGSVGDGLRLGRAAGGATSRAMSSFYGHSVPSPLTSFTEEQYMPLAQYHSNHCILVNRLGRRFCDESHGDEVSVQELLTQPEARGVLLCDERVRAEYVVSEPFPNAGLLDRFKLAAEAGARLTSADTVDGLVEKVAGWDVDAIRLKATLEGYAAAARGEPVGLDAPLPAEPEPLIEPPFHALEVQPAITFTYGGLRTDADGRVLDHDGVRVTGLWAAGVDAGGLSNHTYAGGLAPAFITGRRAAASALSLLAGDTAGTKGFYSTIRGRQ
jgi:succinate dehydrogenase/fumarate reductase flavoprotein subunit